MGMATEFTSHRRNVQHGPPWVRHGVGGGIGHTNACGGESGKNFPLRANAYGDEADPKNKKGHFVMRKIHHEKVMREDASNKFKFRGLLLTEKNCVQLYPSGRLQK